MINAVLTKKRFVVEYKKWDAPMAGVALVGFVRGDLGIDASDICCDRGLHRASVEASASQRLREVIALMPVINLT